MGDITFSVAQKDALVQKLQAYMSKELDWELGQFDAEFLLDFISKEMGSTYYNQGLYDAQVVLSERLDSIADVILELEKSPC
ncbi:DUF2164 domain-containing protein [Paraglaciecola sp.]|uniref:DUF2164 domain-containing protein n=1 Tax=Paraglaciecola sp. TaxID=1920173 RepID=UPI0030F38F48